MGTFMEHLTPTQQDHFVTMIDLLIFALVIWLLNRSE